MAHGGALREFVCGHHLHVQVLALRLAPGLDQPLQHLEESAEVNTGPRIGTPGVPLYLWRGNFNVDDDGRQGGFGQLRGVVDGVGVQDHQLQGFGQLEDPLDLALDLGCTDDAGESPDLSLAADFCAGGELLT